MQLVLTYQQSYKPNNTTIGNNNNNNQIIPKQTTINIPINTDNKVLSFVSIFERLKHSGKCNSCNGVR